MNNFYILKRLKIRSKLIFFPLILILTFAFTYVILNFFSIQNTELLLSTKDYYLPIIKISIDLENKLDRIRYTFQDIAATADSQKFSESDQIASEFHLLVDSLKNKTQNKSIINKIESSFIEYYSKEKVISTRMAEEEFSEDLNTQISELINSYNELKYLLNKFEKESNDKILEHFTNIDNNNDTASLFNFIVVVISLLVSIFVTYSVSKTIVKPFIELNSQLEKSNEKLNDKYIELENANKIIADNLVQKDSLIKELSEIKEKLETINSEKDKFFSIIAHDLKSPFQGFIGITDMMVDDVEMFEKDEIKSLSQKMNSSAKNLFKLLSNLLDWARMKKGNMEFVPEFLNLLQLSKEEISILEEVANRKSIKINNLIDESIIINADKKMVSTVIRNIITNAIKFTNSNGLIEISSKIIDSNFIEVTISDTGIGMPSEIINNLFKINQKVGRRGTNDEESSGLGLLLCKEFIEKHHGTIRAENRVESGSSFIFTLPLKHK